MGLPKINIEFKRKADNTIQRLTKGVVAVIVRDAAAAGPHVLNAESQIPVGLGKANQDYLRRAFTGYVNRPRQVLAFVAQADAADLSEALTWLSTQTFDYLAGPPDVTAEEAQALAGWVKTQRKDHHSIAKAVLPNLAADHEAIVNFAADEIQVGNGLFGAAEYCSRIAGLIAGTPMTSSCTYAPLPEVTDIARMTEAEADAALDGGKFVLIHDGAKVKAAGDVNSLTTLTADRGAEWKQLRTVEITDMIGHDLRQACQDGYVGKYTNSYDNKCLLISAIRDYITALETAGILAQGDSRVEIDTGAVRDHLEAKGTATGELTEQALKEADTGNNVYLLVTIHILGIIKNITIRVDM